jgi:glycosyltransferase involved in cell wall biosynthesis
MVITPRRFSGAERMVVWQSQGLRDRGHEVLVACKPNAPLEAALAEAGIPCQPLAISGKANLLAPFRLARLAREFHADIIHTHLSTASLWGSFAGKLAHLPVVAEVHALNSKTCFVYADQIVTCSAGVRDHLVAQGVAPERIEVLYNGLPPERFEGLRPPEELRAELGLLPGQPVIGVVAHLSEKKGHRHLIAALPELRRRFPGLVCLLLGEGSARDELAAQARQAGVADAVMFLGFREDAVAVMQLMDVVVLPSVAKEGLGLALVEAGFLGKATVGSDCPGIDEVIIHEQTGLLVPPGDSDAVGAAVGRLLGDAERRRRYGAAGRDRAGKLFTLSAMAGRAEGIYLQVLAARHDRRH